MKYSSETIIEALLASAIRADDFEPELLIVPGFREERVNGFPRTTRLNADSRIAITRRFPDRHGEPGNLLRVADWIAGMFMRRYFLSVHTRA
ncbi:MAG: hypothetical protein KGH80_09605 [Xanthomonadaceae bacterium]|nr:hypothetical protein [Xanthomonadaceae bacterium]